MLQQGASWLTRQPAARGQYSRQETYLRHDIACGHASCTQCPAPRQERAFSQLSKEAPHVLFCDQDVLMDQLEVIEELHDLVLPASIVEKATKDAGARKAVRIRELYKDGRRRCHLFDDIHCYATAAAASRERGLGQPPSPAALRTAAYYANHLGSHAPLLVVLSNSLPAGSVQKLPALAGPMAGAAFSGSRGGSSGMHGSGSSGSGGARGGGQQGRGDSRQGRSSDFGGQLYKQPEGKVQVMPLAEYLKVHQADRPLLLELCESLAAAKEAAKEAAAVPGGRALLPAHMPMRALQEGLASGALLQGTLEVSRSDRREACVRISGPPASSTAQQQLVRVVGQAHRNRAMHGDVVVVKLLPKRAGEEGREAKEEVTPGDEAEGEDEAEADPTAEVLVADTSPDDTTGGLDSSTLPGAAPPTDCGQVVGILRRAVADVPMCLATADEAMLIAGRREGGQRHKAASVLCLPLDKRLPAIRIRSLKAAALVGKRFVVRLDSWERSSPCPSGHLVRIIGDILEPACETEAVLVQCGVPWAPFCAAALAELPAGVLDEEEESGRGSWCWQVPVSERRRRTDLTDTSEFYMISVDKRGTTDIDDLMHVRTLGPGQQYIGQGTASCSSSSSSSGGSKGSGGRGKGATKAGRVASYEVGVHIADVSAFVRAGGALDMEARARAMSIYLPSQHLDMLPHALSEDICSLRKGCERLAVSVVWALDRRLEVVDTWMGRTIVKSSASLHYKQAQHILDQDPLGPKWDKSMTDSDIRRCRAALRLLSSYAGKLKKRRLDAGALEVNNAELRFRLDEETDEVVGIVSSQKLAIADHVEELMVNAGAAVALRISRAFPSAALLRCNSMPAPAMFEQVSAMLASAGLKLETSSPKALSSSLRAACAAAPDPWAAALLQQLVARCIAASRYVSSGDAAPGSQASTHFGLALPYYTQFTSPIRRYPDLIVHRQLVAVLDHELQLQRRQQQQLQQEQERQQWQQQQRRGLLQQPAWQQNQQPLPPLLPPYSQTELAQLAEYMNVRMSDGKRAQSMCFELYMLLLFHSKPHVEQALVYAIQPGSSSDSNGSKDSTDSSGGSSGGKGSCNAKVGTGGSSDSGGRKGSSSGEQEGGGDEADGNETSIQKPEARAASDGTEPTAADPEGKESSVGSTGSQKTPSAAAADADGANTSSTSAGSGSKDGAAAGSSDVKEPSSPATAADAHGTKPSSTGGKGGSSSGFKDLPSLLLFVGAYQLRGRAVLVDGRGVAVPPLGLDDDEEEEGRSAALAEAKRKHISCEATEASAKLTDSTTGHVLLDVQRWQKVWVRLSADGNRAHGPKLHITLLQDTHPDVLEAMTEHHKEATLHHRRHVQQQARIASSMTLRQRRQQQHQQQYHYPWQQPPHNQQAHQHRHPQLQQQQQQQARPYPPQQQQKQGTHAPWWQEHLAQQQQQQQRWQMQQGRTGPGRMPPPPPPPNIYSRQQRQFETQFWPQYGAQGGRYGRNSRLSGGRQGSSAAWGGRGAGLSAGLGGLGQSSAWPASGYGRYGPMQGRPLHAVPGRLTALQPPPPPSGRPGSGRVQGLRAERGSLSGRDGPGGAQLQGSYPTLEDKVAKHSRAASARAAAAQGPDASRSGDRHAPQNQVRGQKQQGRQEGQEQQGRVQGQQQKEQQGQRRQQGRLEQQGRSWQQQLADDVAAKQSRDQSLGSSPPAAAAASHDDPSTAAASDEDGLGDLPMMALGMCTDQDINTDEAAADADDPFLLGLTPLAMCTDSMDAAVGGGDTAPAAAASSGAAKAQEHKQAPKARPRAASRPSRKVPATGVAAAHNVSDAAAARQEAPAGDTEALKEQLPAAAATASAASAAKADAKAEGQPGDAAGAQAPAAKLLVKRDGKWQVAQEQEQQQLRQKWQEEQARRKQAAAEAGEAPLYRQVLPAAAGAASGAQQPGAGQDQQQQEPEGGSEDKQPEMQQQQPQDEQKEKAEQHDAHREQAAEPAERTRPRGMRKIKKRRPQVDDHEQLDLAWALRMNDRGLWGAVLDREAPEDAEPKAAPGKEAVDTAGTAAAATVEAAAPATATDTAVAGDTAAADPAAAPSNAAAAATEDALAATADAATPPAADATAGVAQEATAEVAPVTPSAELTNGATAAAAAPEATAKAEGAPKAANAATVLATPESKVGGGAASAAETAAVTAATADVGGSAASVHPIAAELEEHRVVLVELRPSRAQQQQDEVVHEAATALLALRTKAAKYFMRLAQKSYQRHLHQSKGMQPLSVELKLQRVLRLVQQLESQLAALQSLVA